MRQEGSSSLLIGQDSSCTGANETGRQLDLGIRTGQQLDLGKKTGQQLDFVNRTGQQLDRG